MKKPIFAAMTAVMLVAGCATVRDSRLNPFNWFGNSRQEAATLEPKDGYNLPVDRRALVENVVSMSIERTPEGAIISAMGLPPVQGFWDAELVPVTRDERPENGVLSYQFRIAHPFERRPAGTQPSREVSVAHFVSNAKLEGVRQITVIGERTQRSSRR